MNIRPELSRGLSAGLLSAISFLFLAGCSGADTTTTGSGTQASTAQAADVRSSDPSSPPAPPLTPGTIVTKVLEATIESKAATRQSGQPYQISFQAGWNLFSMPFPNASTFTVNGTVLSCYSYDAVNETYVPETFSQAGIGSSANHYQGYWVFCSTPTMLTLDGDGSPQDPLQTSLVTGWNLVGTPLGNAVAASAFQFNSESLAAAASSSLLGPQAFTYSPTAGAYQALSYQTSTLPAFQDSWVFAFQPGTLSTNNGQLAFSVQPSATTQNGSLRQAGHDNQRWLSG